MSKGDAEHAAQHQHGVQERKEPPAPLTLEQRVGELESGFAAANRQPGAYIEFKEDLEPRVAKLEERVKELEAKARPEIGPVI